jgi:hypothetical protein
MINGSSIDGTLHNNPLCDLVEKYSNLRRTHLTGQQKPKLAQFIKTFEEAMVNQEQLYQANKAERQSIFAKSNCGQDKPMFEFLNPDT